MYDDRYTRRQARHQERDYRRQMRYGYRNPMRGVAAGLFIIGLAFAFYFSNVFNGNLFLPIFFAGLAFVSLLGAASSGHPRAIYGGLQSFFWLMGLALCFLIGFWPWILLPVGVSLILGAFYSPITSGIQYSGFMAAPPTYQPAPPPQEPGSYQEGGQQYQYPPQPKQDQPPTQDPQEQEMPPQEHRGDIDV